MLLTIALVSFALAETPTRADSAVTTTAVSDTIVDTVYIYQSSGIPWNNEFFDPNRLLRHESFDPALSVAYTYSVSFIGGSFGTFAQQSYLAHLAYEFSPELHLYADLGLWMPLYSNMRFGTPIAREDVQQGNVQFVMPGIELEYKPTANTTFRLMLVNENDAHKAYGPWRYRYGRCSTWAESYYCR
jgi:hypothetical protein